MSGQHRYRTLLPFDHQAARQDNETQESREGSFPSGRAPGNFPSSQNRTLAACLQCRRSKAKCTGSRPSCRRCLDSDKQCQYDAEPDTTPTSNLRRQKEDLLDLINFLAHRPLAEATEVFNRLRSGADPFEVVSFVRGADLLMGHRASSTGAEDKPPASGDGMVDGEAGGQAKGTVPCVEGAS